MPKKLKITVVIPSYNEVENIQPMYQAVKDVFAGMEKYDGEILFIDNASNDGTISLLRGLAASDPTVKVILNSRNFGHLRSPYHGMLQTDGDVMIAIASDFQDPPNLIPKLVAKWEEGNEIVLAVRSGTQSSVIMEMVRRTYYRVVKRISDVGVIENFNGYGLYDRKIIDIVRKLDDPYPYYRGILSELGFRQATIEYFQEQRRNGVTKNNFFSLFDLAMNGITSLSKTPLRLITLTGFFLAFLSFVTAFGYFIYKIIYWKSFQLGLAPLIIGQFFFNGIFLLFMGVLGEYIGFIHTRVLKRPLVFERERLNFDTKTKGSE